MPESDELQDMLYPRDEPDHFRRSFKAWAVQVEQRLEELEKKGGS